MGGNDYLYAEKIEQTMKEKAETTVFVPWYVRKVPLMHILEKKGFNVKDRNGVLLVSRAR